MSQQPQAYPGDGLHDPEPAGKRFVLAGNSRKSGGGGKELGYQIPRRKMRRESNGNKLIVVFCPTLTNPYYVMLLHGIEEVAKRRITGSLSAIRRGT